jgi:hypothetical protein
MQYAYILQNKNKLMEFWYLQKVPVYKQIANGVKQSVALNLMFAKN